MKGFAGGTDIAELGDFVPDEQWLHQAVAELIDEFGLGPVKAEVGRRAAPKPVGRPRAWDHASLFSLWFIVRTWMLGRNRTVEGACRDLESLGGLAKYYDMPRPQFPNTGDGVLLSTSQHIRKLFYKADAELDKFDERSVVGSLRARLEIYAENLCVYEPFFTTHVEIASEIVYWELVYDSVYDHHKDPATPPSSTSNRVSDLHWKVLFLKHYFEDGHIKKVINRFQHKAKGRQKIWHQIRLITVWFIIQNVACIESTGIEAACRRIASMGGVFEFIDCEGRARSRIASNAARLRHLYYQAENSFDNFEQDIRQKFVTDSKLPSAREQLRELAANLAKEQILVIPILSVAMFFVLERLQNEGICGNPHVKRPQFAPGIDTSRFKFVPDGPGRWKPHPPGMFTMSESIPTFEQLLASRYPLLRSS